jgi:hypothetical protein
MIVSSVSNVSRGSWVWEKAIVHVGRREVKGEGEGKAGSSGEQVKDRLGRPRMSDDNEKEWWL